MTSPYGNHTYKDLKEVAERMRVRARVVYQIVRKEGEEELSRPGWSLWWSGVVAGIGISMSVVAEGMLRRYLPDAVWTPLVADFGYCVGFLIVVLGRFQLFTENTITAVLPLMDERTVKNLRLMIRLWIIVFVANLVGTMTFALATVYGGIFGPELVSSFLDVSRHFMEKPALEMFQHGIPAGFLIAAMVWMIPSLDGADFWVVMLMTYCIALSGSAHVVAGSAEAFLLLANGEIGLWKAAGEFLAPAFLGNVIGGTALFALLAYAQVREEL